LAQQRNHLPLHRFDTSDHPALLDVLCDLHGRVWRVRGGEGALNRPEIQGLHRPSTHRLRAARLLRFHTLRVSGEIAGILFRLTCRNTIHYYLGGFDPAYERLGPGSLLIEYAMTFARHAGQRWFDFLRVSEPYKYGWGATDRMQFLICC
jgi:CelD/BcsL family acetyltransferase involved in cellulose biosynthesis